MIVSRTPMRMSFFGGGSDFPEFFNEYGGSVISTTFDKYCHINLRYLPPFFSHKTELFYAETEKVMTNDEIRHPVIRNALNWLGIENICMKYDADLPARTGLGTSSSFSVGLLAALYDLTGTPYTKRKLADDAIYLERTLCAEEGGWQDQIACAFGGLNRIDFSGDSYTVTPLDMGLRRKEQLENSLRLYFTGLSRFSYQIHRAAGRLPGSVSDLLELKGFVDIAQSILLDGTRSLDDFGHLLNESWQIKRSLSKAVTTELTDLLYSKAMDAGALGGKLLGAGGGGFLLLYVPQEEHESVDRAMEGFHRVDFRFEDGGSTILLHD